MIPVRQAPRRGLLRQEAVNADRDEDGRHARPDRRGRRQVERRGLKAHPIAGAQRTAVGITGNVGALDRGVFDAFPGVLEVIHVSHPYKLVSREFRPDDTVIQVGGAAIGGPELVVIAGPCSVESQEQTLRIARRVKAAGAHVLRGGAYKPRTCPYASRAWASRA